MPGPVGEVPPMPTRIFLLTSMSRELRCQCPIVTPASLGVKGCALAAPAASVVVRKSAAIRVLMAVSLLGCFRAWSGANASTRPACEKAQTAGADAVSPGRGSSSVGADCGIVGKLRSRDARSEPAGRSGTLAVLDDTGTGNPGAEGRGRIWRKRWTVSPLRTV